MTKKNNFLGVILLSGDVHMSEILKMPQPEENMTYNLYEITSSGLTHTQDLLIYGYLLKHRIYETFISDEYKVDKYMDYSFSTFEFDWDNLVITINLRDIAGKIMTGIKVNHNELIPTTNVNGITLEEKTAFKSFINDVKNKFNGKDYFKHLLNFLLISGFFIIFFHLLFFIFKFIFRIIYEFGLLIFRRKKKRFIKFLFLYNYLGLLNFIKKYKI